MLKQPQHNPLHSKKDDLEFLRRAWRSIMEQETSTIIVPNIPTQTSSDNTISSRASSSSSSSSGALASITPTTAASKHLFGESNIRLDLGQKISLERKVEICLKNAKHKVIFLSAVEDHEDFIKSDSRSLFFKKLSSEYLMVGSAGLHDHTMLNLNTQEILNLHDLLDQLKGVKSLFNKQPGILRINCASGKERSVAIATIWLMYTRKMPLLDAMLPSQIVAALPKLYHLSLNLIIDTLLPHTLWDMLVMPFYIY